MSSTKRNLWILVTVSALFIIAQNYFVNRARTARIVSCEIAKSHCSKIKKRECVKRYCCNSMKSPVVVEITSESSEPFIDAFIAVDEPARPLNLGMIMNGVTYPNLAQEAGIEGTVVARVLVDEKENTYAMS